VGANARKIIDAAKRRKISHLEALVAAGVDAAERRQIHGHVQRESVIRAMPPHAQADRRELTPCHVDAWRVTPRDGLCRDWQGLGLHWRAPHPPAQPVALKSAGGVVARR
jgi:hypothetical protein